MKFALHICEANISQRSNFTWWSQISLAAGEFRWKKHICVADVLFLRRVDKKDATYFLLFLSCFITKIKNKMLAANTSSILQTLKANGISMNKSKTPIIQLNNKHNNAINGITLSFFIYPPPFWVYYSTVFGVLQDTRGKEVKYSADAEREIISLRKLWNISLRSMWNKIRPSHLRSKYFTAKLFHLAKPNFTRRRRISLKKAHICPVDKWALFSGGGCGILNPHFALPFFSFSLLMCEML